MEDIIKETKAITRYQWLKMHGICVACGQKDAFPGYVRCPECLEKAEMASLSAGRMMKKEPDIISTAQSDARN